LQRDGLDMMDTVDDYGDEIRRMAESDVSSDEGLRPFDVGEDSRSSSEDDFKCVFSCFHMCVVMYMRQSFAYTTVECACMYVMSAYEGMFVYE
jgi:hypothetical protein